MMYRRVGGRNERYAENAAELVRFKRRACMGAGAEVVAPAQVSSWREV